MDMPCPLFLKCHEKEDEAVLKTYQDSYLLRTKDCDINGEWRFSAILEALQETAGGHCDILGCGRNDLRKKGLAWVLIRSEVQMDRYPGIGDQVIVETFPAPVRHRLFPRYFIIRDADGKIIGKASTLWVLMNLQTRQTAAPDSIASLMPDNSDLKAPLPLPRPIVPLADSRQIEKTYMPVYTDLDANGHMNNAKYADLLCNLLGTDILKMIRIQSMTMNYNAEILPNQHIYLVLQMDRLKCRLAGICEMKMAFEIGCTMLLREQPEGESYD